MIHKSAQEVLDIMKQKKYSGAQKDARKGTILYTPQKIQEIQNQGYAVMGDQCKIEVTEETTQIAAHRLVVKEKIDDVVLLNFASGKHPGGGFLRGSRAQEEDLCRCSGLYDCLANSPGYYEYNNENKTPLYSDHIMYSPKVPWFRKSSKDAPGDLFLASVITAPAPNAGAYLGTHPDGQAEVEKVLRRRAEAILLIAFENGHRNLILGAWGCGVFANSPVIVAHIFKELLQDTMYAMVFDHVTFAIYGDQVNASVFRKILEEE